MTWRRMGAAWAPLNRLRARRQLLDTARHPQQWPHLQELPPRLLARLARPRAAAARGDPTAVGGMNSLTANWDQLMREQSAPICPSTPHALR